MPRQIESRIVKVAARHGESMNNARLKCANPNEDRVGGYQPRVELSSLGIVQGSALGRLLRPELERILGRPFRVVRFSAAPAIRTQNTAAFICSTGQDLELPPITIDPSLHELRKGNRWLGGDEKRLRHLVETPAFQERREQKGWDFRHGRPLANRLGLYALHGAETYRQAGTRMVRWYEEIPPFSQNDIESDDLLVDLAVGHGLATRYGTAMLLHCNPETPEDIEISVAEADKRYKMPNASAFVLSRDESGMWVERDRIMIPEH